MPALPIPQQSDWNNNVYVLATTRIFVMIGLAYLLRSLYNLMPSNWGTHPASIAAGGHSFRSSFHQCEGGAESQLLTSFSDLLVVSDVVGLEYIISDAPVMVPGAVGTGPDLDLEANLNLGIRPPQPSYDPENHTERDRANTRAEDQGIEVSGPFTTVRATQEQDVGVRNGDPHIEQGTDITAGLTGQV